MLEEKTEVKSRLSSSQRQYAAKPRNCVESEFKHHKAGLAYLAATGGRKNSRNEDLNRVISTLDKRKFSGSMPTSLLYVVTPGYLDPRGQLLANRAHNPAGHSQHQ